MFFGLLLCMLGGAIAANMIASVLPHRSIHGLVNIAFGLAGGAAMWTLVSDMAITYPPSLGALIMMLAAGGAGGIAATLAMGGLRNMVFGEAIQS